MYTPTPYAPTPPPVHPVKMIQRRPSRLALMTGLVLLGWILSSSTSRTQGSPAARPHELVNGHPVMAGEVSHSVSRPTHRPRQQASASWSRQTRTNESAAAVWRLVSLAYARRPHGCSPSSGRKSAWVAVEPNYVFQAIAAPKRPGVSPVMGAEQPDGIRCGHPRRETRGTSPPESRAHRRGAFVDTGIDYTHPDLAPERLVRRRPRSPFLSDLRAPHLPPPARTDSTPSPSPPRQAAAVNGGPSCNPMDDHYHGTHVSGTIGAVGNNGVGVAGVNWTTSVMGLKFLDSTGSGSSSDAINAHRIRAAGGKAAFASTGGANVSRPSRTAGGGGGFVSSMLTEIQARQTRPASCLWRLPANAGTNNDTSPFYPASLGDQAHGVPFPLVAATKHRRSRGKPTATNSRASFLELWSDFSQSRSTRRQHFLDHAWRQLSIPERHVDGDTSRGRSRGAGALGLFAHDPRSSRPRSSTTLTEFRR